MSQATKLVDNAKKLDKLRKALDYACEQRLRSFRWNVASDEIEINSAGRSVTVDPVTTKCLIDMLTIMIESLEAEIPFTLIDEAKAAPKKKMAVKRHFDEDEDDDDDEEQEEESEDLGEDDDDY